MHVISSEQSREGDDIAASCWHKGGYGSNCGGFHPVCSASCLYLRYHTSSPRIPQESPNGIIEHSARCVCGTIWGAHAPLRYVSPSLLVLCPLTSMPSSYLASQTVHPFPGSAASAPSAGSVHSSHTQTFQPSFSVPAPIYGVSAPTTASTTLALAPRSAAAIDLFRPPSPSSGNVAQQRRASAQRTLPQHSATRNGHPVPTRRGRPRTPYPASTPRTPFDPIVSHPPSTATVPTTTLRSTEVILMVIPFCVRLTTLFNVCAVILNGISLERGKIHTFYHPKYASKPSTLPTSLTSSNLGI